MDGTQLALALLLGAAGYYALQSDDKDKSDSVSSGCIGPDPTMNYDLNRFGECVSYGCKNNAIIVDGLCQPRGNGCDGIDPYRAYSTDGSGCVPSDCIQGHVLTSGLCKEIGSECVPSDENADTTRRYVITADPETSAGACEAGGCASAGEILTTNGCVDKSILQGCVDPNMIYDINSANECTPVECVNDNFVIVNDMCTMIGSSCTEEEEEVGVEMAIDASGGCVKQGCSYGYTEYTLDGDTQCLPVSTCGADTDDNAVHVEVDASCVVASCNSGYILVGDGCKRLNSDCPDDFPLEGRDSNGDYVFAIRDGIPGCYKQRCKSGLIENEDGMCVSNAGECIPTDPNADPERVYMTNPNTGFCEPTPNCKQSDYTTRAHVEGKCIELGDPCVPWDSETYLPNPKANVNYVARAFGCEPDGCIDNDTHVFSDGSCNEIGSNCNQGEGEERVKEWDDAGRCVFAKRCYSGNKAFDEATNACVEIGSNCGSQDGIVKRYHRDTSNPDLASCDIPSQGVECASSDYIFEPTLNRCARYEYTTSPYGDCTAECMVVGSGEVPQQERSVTCTAIFEDGETLEMSDDGRCDDMQLIKPETSRDCPAIPPCEGYMWTWDGACIGADGTTEVTCGTSTKRFECKGTYGTTSTDPENDCGPYPENEPCRVGLDTNYCDWERGDWSDCHEIGTNDIKICGLGERSRTMTCKDDLGNVDPNSCNPRENPENLSVTKEACRNRRCEYTLGAWSDCKGETQNQQGEDCGTGYQTRSVECELPGECEGYQPSTSRPCYDLPDCRETGDECGNKLQPRVYKYRSDGRCEPADECRNYGGIDYTWSSTLQQCVSGGDICGYDSDDRVKIQLDDGCRVPDDGVTCREGSGKVYYGKVGTCVPIGDDCEPVERQSGDVWTEYHIVQRGSEVCVPSGECSDNEFMYNPEKKRCVYDRFANIQNCRDTVQNPNPSSAYAYNDNKECIEKPCAQGMVPNQDGRCVQIITDGECDPFDVRFLVRTSTGASTYLTNANQYVKDPKGKYILDQTPSGNVCKLDTCLDPEIFTPVKEGDISEWYCKSEWEDESCNQEAHGKGRPSSSNYKYNDRGVCVWDECATERGFARDPTVPNPSTASNLAEKEQLEREVCKYSNEAQNCYDSAQGHDRNGWYEYDDQGECEFKGCLPNCDMSQKSGGDMCSDFQDGVDGFRGTEYNCVSVRFNEECNRDTVGPNTMAKIGDRIDRYNFVVNRDGVCEAQGCRSGWGPGRDTDGNLSCEEFTRTDDPCEDKDMPDEHLRKFGAYYVYDALGVCVPTCTFGFSMSDNGDCISDKFTTPPTPCDSNKDGDYHFYATNERGECAVNTYYSTHGCLEDYKWDNNAERCVPNQFLQECGQSDTSNDHKIRRINRDNQCAITDPLVCEQGYERNGNNCEVSECNDSDYTFVRDNNVYENQDSNKQIFCGEGWQKETGTIKDGSRFKLNSGACQEEEVNWYRVGTGKQCPPGCVWTDVADESGLGCLDPAGLPTDFEETFNLTEYENLPRKSCGGGKILLSRTLYYDFIPENEEEAFKDCYDKAKDQGLSIQWLQDCNQHSCDRDCEYDYTPWSACSQTCGTGVQYRTQRILADPAGNGNPCPSMTSQLRLCNIQACPTDDDCVLGSERTWTCTASCGTGVRVRERNVDKIPQGRGDKCDDILQWEECNTGNQCEQFDIKVKTIRGFRIPMGSIEIDDTGYPIWNVNVPHHTTFESITDAFDTISKVTNRFNNRRFMAVQYHANLGKDTILGVGVAGPMIEYKHVSIQSDPNNSESAVVEQTEVQDSIKSGGPVKASLKRFYSNDDDATGDFIAIHDPLYQEWYLLMNARWMGNHISCDGAWETDLDNVGPDDTSNVVFTSSLLLDGIQGFHRTYISNERFDSGNARFFYFRSSNKTLYRFYTTQGNNKYTSQLLTSCRSSNINNVQDAMFFTKWDRGYDDTMVRTENCQRMDYVPLAVDAPGSGTITTLGTLEDTLTTNLFDMNPRETKVSLTYGFMWDVLLLPYYSFIDVLEPKGVISVSFDNRQSWFNLYLEELDTYVLWNEIVEGGVHFNTAKTMPWTKLSKLDDSDATKGYMIYNGDFDRYDMFGGKTTQETALSNFVAPKFQENVHQRIRNNTLTGNMIGKLIPMVPDIFSSPQAIFQRIEDVRPPFQLFESPKACHIAPYDVHNQCEMSTYSTGSVKKSYSSEPGGPYDSEEPYIKNSSGFLPIHVQYDTTKLLGYAIFRSGIVRNTTSEFKQFFDMLQKAGDIKNIGVAFKATGKKEEVESNGYWLNVRTTWAYSSKFVRLASYRTVQVPDGEYIEFTTSDNVSPYIEVYGKYINDRTFLDSYMASPFNWSGDDHGAIQTFFMELNADDTPKVYLQHMNTLISNKSFIYGQDQQKFLNSTVLDMDTIDSLQQNGIDPVLPSTFDPRLIEAKRDIMNSYYTKTRQKLADDLEDFTWLQDALSKDNFWTSRSRY